MEGGCAYINNKQRFLLIVEAEQQQLDATARHQRRCVGGIVLDEIAQAERCGATYLWFVFRGLWLGVCGWGSVLLRQTYKLLPLRHADYTN